MCLCVRERVCVSIRVFLSTNISKKFVGLVPSIVQINREWLIINIWIRQTPYRTYDVVYILGMLWSNDLNGIKLETFLLSNHFQLCTMHGRNGKFLFGVFRNFRYIQKYSSVGWLEIEKWINSIRGYERNGWYFLFLNFNSRFWTVSFNSISVFKGSRIQNLGWKGME